MPLKPLLVPCVIVVLPSGKLKLCHFWLSRIFSQGVQVFTRCAYFCAFPRPFFGRLLSKRSLRNRCHVLRYWCFPNVASFSFFWSTGGKWLLSPVLAVNEHVQFLSDPCPIIVLTFWSWCHDLVEDWINWPLLTRILNLDAYLCLRKYAKYAKYAEYAEYTEYAENTEYAEYAEYAELVQCV